MNSFTKLVFVSFLLLTVHDLQAVNEKLKRTQSESGAFTKKTVTTTEVFYVEAIAMVQLTSPPTGSNILPVSTTLQGRWVTTKEADDAFKARYNGQYTIVSAISLKLGNPEKLGEPVVTFDPKAERSGVKSQKKITANSKLTPAWGFTKWEGEGPPKCEIDGNSLGSKVVTGNKTVVTATV